MIHFQMNHANDKAHRILRKGRLAGVWRKWGRLPGGEGRQSHSLSWPHGDRKDVGESRGSGGDLGGGCKPGAAAWDFMQADIAAKLMPQEERWGEFARTRVTERIVVLSLGSCLFVFQ